MVTVLQLVDSLAIGGLEQVAVDLANGLEEADECRSVVCATRRSGPLEERLAPGVQFLDLGRRHRFDWSAARRCASWASERGVEIIHAHGSSLFFANLLLIAWQRREPRPLLVWHDHFGRYATERRSTLLYRVLTRGTHCVLAVNQPLRDWAVRALRIDASRCHYLPNSVDVERFSTAPGSRRTPGHVVLCVANFREQKNHRVLVDAFSRVLRDVPTARLRLAGAASEPGIRESVAAQVERLGISEAISILAPTTDIPQQLREADVGVLASASEGLPLAVLEYGAAGLPVVATSVGQVPEVLGNDGSRGLLVQPNDPQALADALTRVLSDRSSAEAMGSALRRRIEESHSREAGVARVRLVYRELLSS